MNEQRLLKIIEDMDDVVANLKGCTELLKSSPENKTSLYIEFGLKQIFVDYFITIESFTSLMLKELKKFKIGLDMRVSLILLMENNIINEEDLHFLNSARLLRNRISHRYKEPSKAELLKFITENINSFDKVQNIVKNQF